VPGRANHGWSDDPRWFRDFAPQSGNVVSDARGERLLTAVSVHFSLGGGASDIGSGNHETAQGNRVGRGQARARLPAAALLFGVLLKLSQPARPFTVLFRFAQFSQREERILSGLPGGGDASSEGQESRFGKCC
jgi:hypothetical protein